MTPMTKERLELWAKFLEVAPEEGWESEGAVRSDLERAAFLRRCAETLCSAEPTDHYILTGKQYAERT